MIMKLRWILYLIAGIVLVVIAIFSYIVITNIVVNKIPPPGMEQHLPADTITGFNYSIENAEKIAPDDPIKISPFLPPMTPYF
jgi:hypothetical protein